MQKIVLSNRTCATPHRSFIHLFIHSLSDSSLRAEQRARPRCRLQPPLLVFWTFLLNQVCVLALNTLLGKHVIILFFDYKKNIRSG